MYLQGSLLGQADPEVDPTFAGLRRIALDDACWVDFLPGWLGGDEAVFDQLYHGLVWNHRTVTMYDRRLPEPRLTSWWTPAEGPEPLAVLAEMRSLLSSRYGEAFDSIGFNCYRDGADSVAWHGDRHRHTIDNPIVVTVSVGARRDRSGCGREVADVPLLRPRPGGPARDGGCLPARLGAHRPQGRVTTGPRISITFRHGMR